MPSHPDRVRRNYDDPQPPPVPRYRCLTCPEPLATIPEAVAHSKETGHAVAFRVRRGGGGKVRN
jgi:hypothetical protein